MTLARFSLAATSLAFFAFGFWLLVQPEALAVVGLQLPNDSARVEIRAMYGGLEIGMGLFFLACLIRRAWMRPGLFCQIASLGGLGLVRLGAIGLSDEVAPLLFVFCLIELAGAIVGIVALRRFPPSL